MPKNQLPLPAPALMPVPMGLFPTKDSLEEAVAYAYHQIPLCTRNEVHKVLMVYHNTLLKALENK